MTDWKSFDDMKEAKLNYQSGGWFWIVQDGGVHGQFMSPAWWTGQEFDRFNNSIITHVAEMDFPEMPYRERVTIEIPLP